MKNKDNYVNLTKIIVIWILATISSLILDYFKIRISCREFDYNYLIFIGGNI